MNQLIEGIKCQILQSKSGYRAHNYWVGRYIGDEGYGELIKL
jgi:hypothetical protein